MNRRGASAAARRGVVEALAFVLILAQATVASGPVPAGRAGPLLDVPRGLRLLVVSPHPDDETLGTGGLIQRVHALGGRVSVAYLTSGDGYLDGVELETGKLKPKPADFVDYGVLRLHEALRALEAMSLQPKSLLIFGFPDGGLVDLLTTYWSSKYVSPYTHDSRSPYPDSVDGRASYSGVSLERALTRVITQLNPDWIAVTAPWDVHPDHCAAFHFVVRALGRLSVSNPSFASVRLLAYTVHRPDWPASSEGGFLDPPADVPLNGAAWRFLELTSRELEGKGLALDQYASQMDIMAVLFRKFIHGDEIFALYATPPGEPDDACGRPLAAPLAVSRP
jgi:LmbE family N-acetylglucosaminyl deacetylase